MKSRRMKGHASVNIMECMSSIMHDTRDLRIPVLLDEKSRQRVSNDCSECISSMILMLNQLRPGCVPEHKIQQVSVGLLYLMR